MDERKLIAQYCTEDKKHVRYVVRSGIAEVEKSDQHLKLNGKNIIVIADRLGTKITNIISEILVKQSCKIVVVASSICNNLEKFVLKKCDFRNPEQTKIVFEEIKEQLGRIDGIINLFSITTGIDFTKVKDDIWREELQSVYWSTFYSLKSAYNDFIDLKKQAFFVVGTNIGGNFGSEYYNSNNCSAGINLGMLKAIGKEIATLQCKSIDFSDVSNEMEVANTILREITVCDCVQEVSYEKGVRKSLRVIPQDIENVNGNIRANKLTEKDIILFAGGGRGILGAFIQGLITIYNPTVIIIGRSKLPSGDEEWIGMSDQEFENYKTIFIKNMKTSNKEMSVIEIIYEFEKMRNQRKVLANICALKKYSKKVHYYTCDISDYKSVLVLEKTIRNRFGNITGIVNGAGLPSFGALPKKHELGSFQSVLVKGMGVYNLYTIFKKHPLGFFQNVGSISGRFGIDGQIDYVAACSLVTQMTKKINRLEMQYPCYTMEWTAWEDIGMAAIPIVEKVQKERGLNYISVKEGTQKFLQELAFGGNEEEILIFDTLGKKVTVDYQLSALSGDLKKLKNPIDEKGYIVDQSVYPYINRVVEQQERYLKVEKILDISTDVHLRDHVVKGNYVFAGVSHIELFVEMGKLLGEMLGEQWYLYEAEKIELKEFIKYFTQNELKLYGELNIKENNDRYVKIECRLLSDFKNSKGIVLLKNRLHSYGKFTFIKEKKITICKKRDVKRLLRGSVELNLAEYYEQTDSSIHFGELFRSLIYTRKINRSEFIGKVVAVDDSKLFTNIKQANTFMFPITMDCIGRVALMGIFNEYGIIAVPIELSNIKMQRDIRRLELLYSYIKVVKIEDENVFIDQEIIDQDDNVIGKVDLTLHVISKIKNHNLEIQMD